MVSKATSLPVLNSLLRNLPRANRILASALQDAVAGTGTFIWARVML
jgi:hypothetical protein